MSEWQPIETAPVDGQHLLLSDKIDVVVGWWDDFGFEGWTTDFTPSHWMPLPDPPQ